MKNSGGMDFTAVEKTLGEMRKIFNRNAGRKALLELASRRYFDQCFHLMRPGRTEALVILEQLTRQGGFCTALGLNQKSPIPGMTEKQIQTSSRRILADLKASADLGASLLAIRDASPRCESSSEESNAGSPHSARGKTKDQPSRGMKTKRQSSEILTADGLRLKIARLQREVSEEDALDMSESEFIKLMLSDNKLKRLPATVFARHLKSKSALLEIANAACPRLQQDGKPPISRDRFMELLPEATAPLWVQLRDREITFAQFEARVFRMMGLGDFTVLDDLWPEIPECIKEALKSLPPASKRKLPKFRSRQDLDDWLKTLNVSKRCQRSIRHRPTVQHPVNSDKPIQISPKEV